MTYSDFLAQKTPMAVLTGMTDIPELPRALKPFQRDITSWSLKRGRCAIFAGTGLGKTLIQLSWGRAVGDHTGGLVLLLAPLAVAQQTVAEARKFGIAGVAYALDQEAVTTAITVTNYDRLHLFDPSQFSAVILDESSIIKSHDSKTRATLMESFGRTPWRLCCTATPAPNDYVELGNHAEFLGIMSEKEMLSMFFVHDGKVRARGAEGQDGWRLKRHAKTDFWRWLASWAIVVRDPNEIGYDEPDYILPPLNQRQITVKVPYAPTDTSLFPMAAHTLSERIGARRSSLAERVSAAAQIVNAEPDKPWLVWCGLNRESEELVKAIPGAEQVTGSEDRRAKSDKLLGFICGRPRVLVSKCSIAGFGMNYQHCADMVFVGMNDSFEQLFQAKRRCWRFGQSKPVNVYLISSELEGAVLANLERKEADYEAMSTAMADQMKDLVKGNLHNGEGRTHNYTTAIDVGENWEMRMGDAAEEMASIRDGTIHFSLHSPPFASLYTFSDSVRDLSNCSDDRVFWEHYAFVIAELFRVTMPGRLCAIHCMNLPTSKLRDGFIGLRDFRGDIIRAFQGDDAAELYRAIKITEGRASNAFSDGDSVRGTALMDICERLRSDLEMHPGNSGFYYHSEICIRKDPVSAMQRSKALGLLHKQVVKDSSMSRQAVADYVVVMRKPGENAERVAGTFDRYYGTDTDIAAEDPGRVAARVASSYSVAVWQRYAEPVWMDISQSDVLSNRLARSVEDERHITPLQLTVIRRCYQMWTNPGDLILSPFAGIGSEGYVAIEMDRRFLGVELKQSYYDQAVANLHSAERSRLSGTLFSFADGSAS